MGRFFFDIEHGDTLRDEDGEMLHDPAAARRVAVLVLAERLQMDADDPGRLGVVTVRVRDADGIAVHAVRAHVV